MSEVIRKLDEQMASIERLERMAFVILPRLAFLTFSAIAIGTVFGFAVGSPTTNLFMGDNPPRFGLIEILTLTFSLAAVFNLLLLITLYGTLANLPIPLRFVDQKTLAFCGWGSMFTGISLVVPGAFVLCLGNPAPGMRALQVVAAIVLAEGLVNFTLATISLRRSWN